MFKKNKKDLNNSEKYSNQVLSLPMHPFLKNDDVKRVIKEINLFQKNERIEIKPAI